MRFTVKWNHLGQEFFVGSESQVAAMTAARSISNWLATVAVVWQGTAEVIAFQDGHQVR